MICKIKRIRIIKEDDSTQNIQIEKPINIKKSRIAGFKRALIKKHDAKYLHLDIWEYNEE